MDRALLFRRFLHCLMALSPLYFLLPTEVPVLGVGRWALLVVFIAAVLLVETTRLVMGWDFFGLRPYERNQIASFVWAAAGVTLALWLFREDVATAAIIGWALVDPLSGELRRATPRLSVSIGVPVVSYSVIAGVSLYAWDMMSVPIVLAASVVGAVVAVVAEMEKIRYVDDDFLMILVPCVVMQLFAL